MYDGAFDVLVWLKGLYEEKSDFIGFAERGIGVKARFCLGLDHFRHIYHAGGFNDLVDPWQDLERVGGR